MPFGWQKITKVISSLSNKNGLSYRGLARFPFLMQNENAKLINSFFTEVRITDELCDSSVFKYNESINKFLSISGDKFIGDLENEDFDDFIVRMKANGASGSRISNVISAMKKILNYLKDKQIIKLEVDMDKIRKPKIQKKETNYLTEDEIKMLITTIRNDLEDGEAIRKIRMMLLVIFLLQTGARIGEALSIKIADIDRINLEIPIIGKGSKPRNLFISEDILYWVDRYLAIRKSPSEYLFVTLNGKSAWKQTDVGRSFRYYKKKSGIVKHFTLHTLRHTSATQLAIKGAPMNVIQKILGHSKLETTVKFYIGAADNNMAKKLMHDERFRIIPQNLIYKSISQNPDIGRVPSSPAPCQPQDNIYR